MRENLPAKPHKQEMGVINLDKRDGVGTYWVAYKISGGVLDYFDSYGNLPPPKEIMYYARNLEKIKYNRKRFQRYEATDYGLWCLKFLTCHLPNHAVRCK
jgi:hypothetical protein